MTQTKEQILQQLRTRWGNILDEDDGLEVDIELFTADGNSDQPLAYDIIQCNDSKSVTYTCVEMPDAVDATLGLAAVTYDQAIETLRNLLLEARLLASDTDSGVPVELTLTSVIKTDGLGMTYGRYYLPGDEKGASFRTNYQAYFTTNLLRNYQYQQSGVLFNQVTASLDSSEQFSLRFGD